MQNICLETAHYTGMLEKELNKRKADFDSVVIYCSSVDNSPSGVVYTAKFKEQVEAVKPSHNIDYTASLHSAVREWLAECPDGKFNDWWVDQFVARLNSVVKAQQNCA